MISPKQRAFLRSLSNQMSPIFQIGKQGITSEIVYQLGNALEARELIKISILDTCPYSPRECADGLSEELGSEVVSVCGKKITLFRKSVNKPKIELP